MSELELSLFRQRSQEALRQKARRGALFLRVATGYVEAGRDRIGKATADFGPEVVINPPPSRACAGAVLTLDAVCTALLDALFREDKLRNEASVGQAALKVE
jgi:hypothetical protein